MDVELFPTKKTKDLYKIKIALIPMRIPKEYFESVRKKLPSEVLKVPRIKLQFSEEVATTLISKIKWACDAGAKIVCCSEYCYPIIARY